MEADEFIDSVAVTPHGLDIRPQLVDGGVSRRMIDSRLTSGRLTRGRRARFRRSARSAARLQGLAGVEPVLEISYRA